MNRGKGMMWLITVEEFLSAGRRVVDELSVFAMERSNGECHSIRLSKASIGRTTTLGVSPGCLNSPTRARVDLANR